MDGIPHQSVQRPLAKYKGPWQFLGMCKGPWQCEEIMNFFLRFSSQCATEKNALPLNLVLRKSDNGDWDRGCLARRARLLGTTGEAAWHEGEMTVHAKRWIGSVLVLIGETISIGKGSLSIVRGRPRKRETSKEGDLERGRPRKTRNGRGGTESLRSAPRSADEKRQGRGAERR